MKAVGVGGGLNAARVLRAMLLALVVLLGAFSFSYAPAADATAVDQATAYSNCVAEQNAHPTWIGQYPSWTCSYVPEVDSAGPDPNHCYPSQSHYDIGNYQTGEYSFTWCLRVCTADDGAHVNQQWPGNIAVGSGECDNGCYYEFQTNPGMTSLCFSANCTSWGFYRETGATCGSASLAPPVAPSPPQKPCGGSSCYDPQHGYCAVTESGEQICTGDDPKPNGCISGATGTVCTSSGNPPGPPPTPPDPPISPGQPPSGTDTATTKTTDASGTGTTGNTIINVYNGTDTASPGTTTGGADGSGVGGSSNSTGSGNSNDKGTDSSGKCPDGSVPTAGGCSATFSDSGCQALAQAAGDALLAAIAKESQQQRCEELKMNNYLKNPPSDSTVFDPFSTSDDGTAAEVSKSEDLGDTSKLDATGFGYGGSCPAEDMTVQVGSGSFVVPFSKACEWGEFLRAFILAFAYFGAAKVIAGVK